MMVIYRIDTLDNGVYIGQAEDYETRKTRHINDLKARRHANWHLTKTFKNYGEDGLEFSIVEIVECEEHLTEREQYWMDFIKDTLPAERVFNIIPTAGRSPKGRPVSDETRRKHSERMKGHVPTMAIEASVIKLRGKSSKNRTYTLISPEGETITVESLSLFAKERGLDASSLYKVYSGKLLQYKGWRLPVAIRQDQRGIGNAKVYTFISPEGEVITISNLTQFCRDNNLNQGNMNAVHNGTRKSHKGYIAYKI